jgi:hypothetical protein
MPHSPLQGEQSAAAEHVTQLPTGVLSLLNRHVAHPDLERQAPGDFVDIPAVALAAGEREVTSRSRNSSDWWGEWSHRCASDSMSVPPAFPDVQVAGTTAVSCTRGLAHDVLVSE